MVKLATARECRIYGPRLARRRSEYMNAGLYVFATILVTGGFAAQFSGEPRSGLVLLLIGYLIMIIVNVHDLIAHLAGIDYRLPLLEFDMQLALVEFAVPLVYIVGTIFFFLATLFVFIQAERGYGYFKLERVALRMFIAGPVLWLLGSIHNSCQIYETSDGHVQMLQEAVLIPFLMASLLFLVSAILNSREQMRHHHRHGLQLLSEVWIWLNIFGSLILFIGGLANVVKVFKMQRSDGLRLEKLRGGAQEQLAGLRDVGERPFIAEETRRALIMEDHRKQREIPTPTPYKDVLIGHP